MKIIDLRHAPQHLQTLAQWHHLQWADLNPGSTLAGRIEKMAVYLGDTFIPTTYMAMDPGLLGSAAIVAHDLDTRPDLTPWLASVYVAPEHRKKGVATKLVKHVMDKAEQAGIKTLYLFTPDQEPFYKKLGWHTLSKDSYHGHEVTVMQVGLNR
jgi:GNAT superfamily N-acetyltransferase